MIIFLMFYSYFFKLKSHHLENGLRVKQKHKEARQLLKDHRKLGDKKWFQNFFVAQFSNAEGSLLLDHLLFQRTDYQLSSFI